jgi:hypothetical protein
MSTRKKKDAYPAFKTIAEFRALSAEEKDRVWDYYDREKIPMSESRPLNAEERALFEQVRQRSVDRPKIGQGAKVVAVTMEKGFLNRVDAYAKKHALKRAEMITRGLRLVMGDCE